MPYSTCSLFFFSLALATWRRVHSNFQGRRKLVARCCSHDPFGSPLPTYFPVNGHCPPSTPLPCLLILFWHSDFAADDGRGSVGWGDETARGESDARQFATARSHAPSPRRLTGRTGDLSALPSRFRGGSRSACSTYMPYARVAVW